MECYGLKLLHPGRHDYSILHWVQTILVRLYVSTLISNMQLLWQLQTSATAEITMLYGFHPVSLSLLYSLHPVFPSPFGSTAFTLYLLSALHLSPCISSLLCSCHPISPYRSMTVTLYLSPCPMLFTLHLRLLYDVHAVSPRHSITFTLYRIVVQRCIICSIPCTLTSSHEKPRCCRLTILSLIAANFACCVCSSDSFCGVSSFWAKI